MGIDQSKKILFSLVLVIFSFICCVAIVLIAEKIINSIHSRAMNPDEIENMITINTGVKRYVDLREHRPGEHKIVRLSAKSISRTDNLVDREYVLRVDDNGFIMPSKIYESPELSLVFLGGSTTESGFVSEKKRFPYLVGRLLEQETGRKTNSYNSGNSGGTSLHSINILLNKIIPLNPDIVILMHNINDFNWLHNNDSYYPDYSKFPAWYWTDYPGRAIIVTEKAKGEKWHQVFIRIRDLTIPHLYSEIQRLFPNIRNILRAPFGLRGDQFKENPGIVKGKAIDQELIILQFKQALRTFIEICQAWGIRPVLMTQVSRLVNPNDQEGSPSYRLYVKEVEQQLGLNMREYIDTFLSLNTAIRRVAVEKNVLLIDLENKITSKGAGPYLYDHIHYNDEGSELVAELISREIMKVLD